MALSRWMVFEPPRTQGVGDKAVFVRDRFSVIAFLVPWLWLLSYRLWLAGLAVLALGVLLAVLTATVPAARLPATVLPILIGLLVALEGPSLRARRLRAKGWRESAAFEADGLAEAEIRYFARRDESETVPEPAPRPASLPPRRHPPLRLGFFDAGRGR